MNRNRRGLFAGIKSGSLTIVLMTAGVLAVAGCGSDATNEASQTARAAGASLQEAMDDAARDIDEVQGRRSSLERLSSNLEPSIAQTGDVVVTLTPNGAGAGAEASLLSAARDQRSFIQFASDAAAARSRSVANSALSRARSFGLRATTAYSKLGQNYAALAGSLPSSTTFNIGQLQRAVRQATRKRGSNTSSGGPTDSGGGNGYTPTSSCPSGVSVNSVTSCEFAANVAAEYRSSGSSVIYAFSPATGREYRMTCTGFPTVCRGGNNAEVTIR